LSKDADSIPVGATKIRLIYKGFRGAHAFRRDTIAARLNDAGDVFASEVKLIASQKFANVPTI
jgi:hypothetical protein